MFFLTFITHSPKSPLSVRILAARFSVELPE